jgi:hypothetical protein
MGSDSRENQIAQIIKNYSNKTMDDRNWLENCNEKDSAFRNSFCKIWKYTTDPNIALWYLSYSQTYGNVTDTMHSRMTDIVLKMDRPVASFKQDLPHQCPFFKSKNEVMEKIFSIDFNLQNDEIKQKIKQIFKSEKYNNGAWCNPKFFSSCKYQNECPLKYWLDAVGHTLPSKNGGRLFFYFDSLCILNNSIISGFDQLFSKIEKSTNDNSKQTIIITSLFDQIRGITTKSLMFLQKENQFYQKKFDEKELIFIDRRAIRVIERLPLPYYSETSHLKNPSKRATCAIQKIMEKYQLTANQIDAALYGMGNVCSEKGCLHNNKDRICIFFETCEYPEKVK